MNLDAIADLSGRVARLEDDLEDPRLDLKEAIKQGCESLEIRRDAFKLVHKIKRKMRSEHWSAYRDTFDATWTALGLDAQQEMFGDPDDSAEVVDMPKRRGRPRRAA